MDNLDDFRFFFTDESQLGDFAATDSTLKDAALRLQTSRLRQAWSAVRAAGTKREKSQSVSDVADLDDILEEVTLREVKQAFWKRHKLRYPTEIMPCDALVSRCFREQERRLLMVYDIWNVKNLMYQVTKTLKRKKLSGDLWIYEADEEKPLRSYDRYLSNLHTYLLAPLHYRGDEEPRGGGRAVCKDAL